MHTRPDQGDHDRGDRDRRRRSLGFLATFLAAWMALDRLVTSPPTLVSSFLCLAVAGGIVALGERFVFGVPWTDLADGLGFRRPRTRALAVAAGVGALVFATYLLGGMALGVDLEIRSNWPVVLASAFLFHGLAEELVWRGFAFAHLRRRLGHRQALFAAIPLIAMTHVPIIAGNGVVLGTMAVLSAAVTCVPLAHLWEHSGRTVWGPAVLHGAIGTWQLFERDYPDSFSAVLVTGSILVPLLVLRWRPSPPSVADERP